MTESTLENKKLYANIGYLRKYEVEMDTGKGSKNFRPFKKSKNKAVKLMESAVNAISPGHLASVFYESGNEYLTSFVDGAMFYKSLDLVPGRFASEYAMQTREAIYRLSILKDISDLGFISKNLADWTAIGIINSVKKGSGEVK